jgi:hypothetical protein
MPHPIQRSWRGVIAATLLQCAPAAFGQQWPVDNLGDFERQGFVFMDDINTPLLHYVSTGADYDLRVLAAEDSSSVSGHVAHPMRGKVRRGNEFERNEALPVWGRFIDERVAGLKNLQGYLIPMRFTWGEYDFAKHGFALKVAMAKTAFRGNASYHCSGAYKKFASGEYRTACLTSAALNSGDARLQFFSLPDTVLARKLKTGGAGANLYALAVPQGAYRPMRGNEIRYMPLEIYAASGVQSVTITALVLADARNGQVYAVSAVGGAVAPATRNVAVGGTGTGTPAARNAAEGWTLVYHDERSTLYVDAGSARRQGPVASVRALMNFQAGQTGVASSTATYTYNCNQRTFSQADLAEYAETMARGEVRNRVAAEQDFGRVGAGTNSEILMNYVCNANALK